MRTTRLSIRTKLFGGSALLLALTAALGLLAVRSLQSVDERANAMFNDGVTPIASLSEARSSLATVDRATLRAILREGRGADYAALVRRNATTVEAQLAKVAPRLDVVEQQDDLRQIQTLWAEYDAAVGATLALVARRDEASLRAAEQRYFSQLAPADAKLEQLITELNGDRTRGAKDLDAAVASTYDAGRTRTLAFLALAILLGLGVSWWIARGVRNGVAVLLDRLETLRTQCSDLRAAIRAAADGDLTQEVVPATPPIDSWSNDEIGDAAQAVNGIRD